ncbi:hypothetical protein HYR99_14230 [Candidatus Poribacteria bacterium]|nr:hypothetical protein [Candidatus Poribacteria bacterium]
MTQTALDRPIGSLTLQELRDIIRQVVREEAFSLWRTDKDGNLIFLFEEDYAAYLAQQKGKLRSEINAYFMDEQGFTVRYADEVPTARTRRRIEQAKQEIAEGKGLSLEEVRQRFSHR